MDSDAKQKTINNIRKPWKLVGPVKPFLVDLYLKTEKCSCIQL